VCVCVCVYVCVILIAKEQLSEYVCHEGFETYEHCVKKIQHSLHIIQLIPQHTEFFSYSEHTKLSA
jgi:hypothetical protein